MKKQTRYIPVFPAFSWIFLFTALVSCHSSPRGHLASATHPGSCIYIDQDNTEFLVPHQKPTEKYIGFRVGWKDSTLLQNPVVETAKESYFEGDIRRDFIAICKGDTLYPAFIQQKPADSPGLKECVLVYLVHQDDKIDTLVFQNKYISWSATPVVFDLKATRKE